MSDDLPFNGDERRAERDFPTGDGTPELDVNELLKKFQNDPELLKKLLNDPNLQSQLRAFRKEAQAQARPETDESPSPFLPRVNDPTKARSQTRRDATNPATPVLPSAFPTTKTPTRSALPDAGLFRRNATTTTTTAKAASLEPPPQRLAVDVPAPTRRDELEGIPKRHDSNLSAILPSKRRSRQPSAELDANLSEIAPSVAPSENYFSKVDANAIAPTTARREQGSANDETLRSLAVVAPNEPKNATDLFLELLERRAAPTTKESAAADVAFLHDETALERAANDAPMWLVSLIIHIVLLLILAFFVVNSELKENFQVVSTPGFSDEMVFDEVYDPEAALESSEDVEFDTPEVPEVETEVLADTPDVSAFTEETAAPLTMMETSLALDAAPLGDVENMLGSLNGNDLSGRGENRAAALVAGGGTEGSEKSVALALAWLAEHQLPNGSWSYNLQNCPSCGGACRDSGSNSSTIAATAMGVLPFLAAGNTPTKGKYKRVVARGVDYLLSQGEETEYGLSFRDGSGNMYAHGLATITLCETYAMLDSRERSRYRQLAYITQEAERYIEYAQATDGGWRYSPKQAGDTSVSGWQMMALKSAQLAGLSVSSESVFAYRSFLRDVVAYDGGSRYLYIGGGSESLATSAIGLLCRLYMDWGIDNPSLKRGVERLASADRSLNNPYYTYYAALLLYQVGGRVWNDWNREVREKLIKAQRMEGHQRGSWFPEDPDGHCRTGGRLYATSLNCLVLEVYYRFMPLSRKIEESEAFPLEGPDAEKETTDASKPKERGEADEEFPIEDFSDPEDEE